MIKKIITLSALSASLFAAQNDIYPTDYVANKIGDVVTTLYFSESSADEVYSHDNKILNETMKTSLQVLRVGYTTEFSGFATAFTAVVYNAKTTFDGAMLEKLYPKETSGFGDVRLGMTTWLINDSENMEYFAITPMLSLPLGKYDASSPINIGENRYKATLSAGYVNRIIHHEAGELFLELSPEIAFFGDNDNARGKKIKQDPSFALTAYLRYRPVPYIGIFTGYQINQGGETSVNDIWQNDEPNNSKLMFGGAIFLYGTQIILRHAQDLHVKNGFKTNNQTTLRLQWNF